MFIENYPLIILDPTSKVTLSGPQTILAGDVATFSCKSHNVSGHSTFRYKFIITQILLSFSYEHWYFRWFIGNTELYDHTDSDDDGDTHKSMLRYRFYSQMIFTDSYKHAIEPFSFFYFLFCLLILSFLRNNFLHNLFIKKQKTMRSVRMLTFEIICLWNIFWKMHKCLWISITKYCKSILQF